MAKIEQIDFLPEVLEIEKRSFNNPCSYTFNEHDRKRVLEILEVSRNLSEEDFVNKNHYIHKLLWMIKNTIDKKLAEKLPPLFDKYSFDHFIEASIMGQFMRISGH